MSFTEAFKLMISGRKVKRPTFQGYWYINQEDGVFMIHLPNEKNISYGKLDITVRNCLANDWEVVEE